MIIDMHCDTISEIRQRRSRGEEDCCLRENQLHIDARRLRESGYMLQCFALFVDLQGCGAMGADGALQPEKAWEELQALYRLYREELALSPDVLQPVCTKEELERCRKEQKVAALLTVEEGGVCGGSLEKLEELYAMGVRMMTLTWNYPNELGYPNLDAQKHRLTYQELFRADAVHGLTETGRSFVMRMEELGMLVDVSHLSDRGFWDVLEISRTPIVASHSNARAVCPCARNLTDEMIRALTERGGVMGLNFCKDFLYLPPEGVSTPGSFAPVTAHAAHIFHVGGEDCLGLGSDFDGIDTNDALPGAQAMEKLWTELKRSGFTERQLDKIFYGNALRVLLPAIASE